MESVKVEIEVAKESKEVVDAVVELIADIRAGKDISLIAGENLPGLLKAVEGVDKLGEEMKSNLRNETISYAGLKLADVIAPDEAAA